MARFDHPVEFVTTREDGSLGINEDVVDYLKTLSDKKVTVVAIVGEARKGKSFLLNRLMGANSGFPLGPTVHSTTKGIWICMRPHPRDASRLLILLDTEGLGDPAKGDNKHDCWIFTLALLLSSAFVYNSMGSINQQALDFLQLAAELTEKVKMKDDQDDESGEDFAKLFPELIWVLRDFFLELKDPLSGDIMTPNDYLESCLVLEKGYSKRVEEGNRLKRRLRDFFHKRNCFVLPRPVPYDEDMKVLDTLGEGDLSRRFVVASKVFTDYVLETVKNKIVDSMEISASFFASLAEQYVEAVQTKFVCIESSVNAVKAAANQKALEDALQIFDQKLSKIDLPLSPERLGEALKLAYGQAREHFLGHAFGIGKKDADGLLKTLAKRATGFEEENGERCAHFCKGVIKTLYEPIRAGLDGGKYMKSGGHKKIVEDVSDFYNKYMDDERINRLGVMADAVLKKFLNDEVDPTLKLVLASDVSLTKKEREIEEAKQESDRIKRQAELEQQERAEMLARMEEGHRQRLEDEARLRQEQHDVTYAIVESLQEYYNKLLEETKRLIREGHQKETEALREQMKQLDKKIADLKAKTGGKKKNVKGDKEKCFVQ